MAEEEQQQDNQQQGEGVPPQMQNVNPNPVQAVGGMNLNSILRQVKPGQLTFAQNAAIDNFEGNSVAYQNETGNTLCYNFPVGYVDIGHHLIPEQDRVVWWLVNPITGASEIGVGYSLTCQYVTLVNQACLNFNINYPIHKSVHKITACGTEVYWTDVYNSRRYMDIDNLPYAQTFASSAQEPCEITTLTTIDCNKLNIQPNFAIPQIIYKDVTDGGNILEGTYQFAVQYTNFEGNPYTSYYSITNPIPILNPFIIGPDFNYNTGRSIRITVSNIDTTGLFDYFNIAVIKTINNITSVDLVGTFQITQASQTITYTGTSKEEETLSINDIFEKYVYFDTAEGCTTVQDVLVWNGLTTNERVNYQLIANLITPKWVTYKVPPTSNLFADPLNSANIKGNMRDEIYPYGMVVVLKNGYQSDFFPFIGRAALPSDLEVVSNGDVQSGGTPCTPPTGLPRWQVYNTGSLTGYCPEYIGNESNDCYEGPYQYGEFGYWESTEQYPCNEAVWGSMQGQQIRHFLFPDNSITNHHDNEGNIYPIGVMIDAYQLYQLLETSSLTQEQKDAIACVKIVRGDRATNKSVIAKGLLYNVGAYTNTDQNNTGNNGTYFFPNYPYNDLREDPFIKGSATLTGTTVIVSNYNEAQSNGPTVTALYTALIPANQLVNIGDQLIATYQGQYNGTSNKDQILGVTINNENAGGAVIGASAGTTWSMVVDITMINATTLSVTNTITTFGVVSFTGTTDLTINNIDLTQPITIVFSGSTIQSSAGQIGITAISETITYLPGTGTVTPPSPYLSAFETIESQRRFTFHSPDTSFYQPALGTQLKLESVEYGLSRAHFVQVKGHAKYKFPSLGSYLTSLGIGVAVGFASATVGVSDNIFNGAAAFTAFEVFNDLIYKLIPRRNFAYQFNSIGYYDNNITIPNDTGNKIRSIDIASYLASGLQGNSDTYPINNYQRESSVYLRTTTALPFQDSYTGIPSDTSRYPASAVGCDQGFYENPISAYYASLKNQVVDQYGEIYSFQTVDTGFQLLIDLTLPLSQLPQQYYYVFGGDTFINRFAFKRKFPFFLDNRVNFPDDSDIFYDEIGNICNPSFWFSTDITQGNGGSFGLGALFGVKVNSFDCKNGSFFYDSGKFYLFAYGLPYYYVESQINIDYRQAANDLAGDFWPHISNDVPDEWLQEINVPIALDNSYNYNKSFSKQNDENVFTTLPTNYVPNQPCTEQYPNKAIWSDVQEDPVYYKKNSWLLYHPDSYFDFPLNYGALVDLEGIEDKEIIARFENRMVIYNTLITLETSSPQAAYLGNPTLFKNGFPIDFADTDAGYAGTQHKMFIKTDKGHVAIDAKRGEIHLIPKIKPYFGRRVLRDLAGPEFNCQQFFCEALEFRILRTFPSYPIDNHFNGIGLHGVYDLKYERLIITKIDYEVINSNLGWNSATLQFYDLVTQAIVILGDPNYFCNRSFTISFSFKTNSWISFHTYIPNFYVAGPSYFFSGVNNLTPSQSSNWIHNRTYILFNSFYGIISPYIIEYPFAYKIQDEIVQNVKDYTKVLQYSNNVDYQSFIEVDNVYFDQAILYNNQQTSGLLNLVIAPAHNLLARMSYPQYGTASKSILVTKANNFYNYNTFWDVVANKLLPIFSRDCTTLSTDKILVQSNMDYSMRSFKKAPLMAKDLRVRHILNTQSSYKFISQFLLAPSQPSYK